MDYLNIINGIIDVLQVLRIEAKSELKKKICEEKVGTNRWTKIELLEKSRYILSNSSYVRSVTEQGAEYHSTQ